MTTIRLLGPTLKITFGTLDITKKQFAFSFESGGECMVLKALNSRVTTEPYPSAIMQKDEVLQLIGFLKKVYKA